MILRGPAAAQVNVACLDADLRISPYARHGIVDARLVDPALAKVVDDAVAAATAQARADGFARGYADGMAAAEEQTRQAIERERRAMHASEAARQQSLQSALATLDAAGTALADRQATALSGVEELLLEAAFQLAGVLLGRELRRLDAPVRDAVRRALAVLPGDVPVTVTVHPDDVAALAELAELDDDITAGRVVRINTDPTIEPGSCCADGGFCHVEASLSAALERVRQVLSC